MDVFRTEAGVLEGLNKKRQPVPLVIERKMDAALRRHPESLRELRDRYLNTLASRG